MDNSYSDKINRLKGSFPELYKTTPKKENQLAFLKSCPYRRSMFRYYSNPVIGYNHVLDPSNKKGIPKKKLDIPKARSVNKKFSKCFPEMKGGKGYID